MTEQYAKWLTDAAANIARDARRKALAEVHAALLADKAPLFSRDRMRLARAANVVAKMMAEADRS